MKKKQLQTSKERKAQAARQRKELEGKVTKCPYCRKPIYWKYQSSYESHFKCAPGMKVPRTSRKRKKKKKRAFFPVWNSADYRRYLRTPHWRKMKNKMYKYRKMHCCEACGSNYRVAIHHKNYKRLWNEKLSDLMFLCCSCHEIEHFGLAADSPEQ